MTTTKELVFPHGCEYAKEFKQAYGVDVNTMDECDFTQFVVDVATGKLTKKSRIYPQYKNVLCATHQSGVFNHDMEVGLVRMMLMRLVKQAKLRYYEKDSESDLTIAIESVAKHLGSIPTSNAKDLLLQLGDIVIGSRYFHHSNRASNYPSALYGFVRGVFDGLLTFRRQDAAKGRDDRLADSIPLFQNWEQEMIDVGCTDLALDRLRELISFNSAIGD